MSTAKSIVLLHGWGATTEKLAPLADALKTCGWRVTNLPIPGFDLPPPSTPWSLDRFAKHVVNAITYQSPVVFFGHSFGGALAVKVALHFPGKVKGLVLCATRGISRTNPVKRSLFLLLAKTGKFLVGSSPLLRTLLYRLAAEHDYHKSEGIMRETLTKVVAEDIKPSLGRISHPVLLLWGRTDSITPLRDAYQATSLIPQSHLKVYEHAGHTLPYHHAEAVAKEIDEWYTKHLS